MISYKDIYDIMLITDGIIGIIYSCNMVFVAILFLLIICVTREDSFDVNYSIYRRIVNIKRNVMSFIFGHNAVSIYYGNVTYRDIENPSLLDRYVSLMGDHKNISYMGKLNDGEVKALLPHLKPSSLSYVCSTSNYEIIEAAAKIFYRNTSIECDDFTRDFVYTFGRNISPKTLRGIRFLSISRSIGYIRLLMYKFHNDLLYKIVYTLTGITYGDFTIALGYIKKPIICDRPHIMRLKMVEFIRSYMT